MAEVNIFKEVSDDVEDKPTMDSLTGQSFLPAKIWVRYAKYGDSDWEIIIRTRGPVVKKKDASLSFRQAEKLWTVDHFDVPDWIRKFVEQHAPKEVTDPAQLWANDEEEQGMDRETHEKVQMIARDLGRLLDDITNNRNPEDTESDLKEALPDLQTLVEIAEDL